LLLLLLLDFSTPKPSRSLLCYPTLTLKSIASPTNIFPAFINLSAKQNLASTPQCKIAPRRHQYARERQERKAQTAQNGSNQKESLLSSMAAFADLIKEWLRLPIHMVAAQLMKLQAVVCCHNHTTAPLSRMSNEPSKRHHEHHVRLPLTLGNNQPPIHLITLVTMSCLPMPETPTGRGVET
jgi:hypothetical protein